MKIELSENEIRFLIAIMWGSPLGMLEDAAMKYNVDDAALEQHLQNQLIPMEYTDVNS